MIDAELLANAQLSKRDFLFAMNDVAVNESQETGISQRILIIGGKVGGFLVPEKKDEND